jgi:hypothetical protein
MRRVGLALFLVPLPAALFLAPAGYFSSSDGMIHLYRLFELDRALHAGVFYPRWFPLSGYGYGLPVLNYYSPLSYYLAELFHLAGAGYIDSIKWLIVLSFAAAAFSMFLFARDLFGDAPAFIAGAAYAYLPYFLSDAFVRGNFPELLAMSLLPLALWAFRRLFDYRRVAEDAEKSQPETRRSPRCGGEFADGRILIAAFAFAAIILVHHLTAMLFAALLVAYILFLFTMHRDGTRLAASAAAILLALALSAFYWLPALGELDLVYVGPAAVARFLVNRLVGLSDFFAPSLAYVYLPQSEVLKHAAGFPQTMLALAVGMLALVSAFRQRDALRNTQHTTHNTFYSLFFFLVVAASIFMTLTFSAPLWYAIPPLRFMQFPWRFQILAGIGIAFLLGAGAKWTAEAFARFNASHAAYAVSSVALAEVTLVIALGVANLPVRMFPLTDAQVNLLHSSDPDYVVAQMGWGWTREFVPATVQDADSVYAPIPKPSGSPSDSTLAAPTIWIVNDGLLSESLRVSTRQPFDLSLHTFYFPAWQAYIDGAPARTFPRGSLGLASVTVPPGDHAVTFQFQDTPLRTAANLISLLTACGVLMGLILARRRAGVAALGALVCVAALWFLSTRAADTAPPTPRLANLDHRAMLVGYSTDRVGETMYVTLYWFALSAMDQNYQVSVHLVDSTGRTVAQQDAPPDQGLTPTTRWMPGEIVTDHHALALTGVDPGGYRLTAAMYLPLDNGYANLGAPVELGRVRVDK